VVFWNDPDREFDEMMPSVALDGVTVLRVSISLDLWQRRSAWNGKSRRQSSWPTPRRRNPSTSKTGSSMSALQP